ncbi:MAG: hypothetical protein ACLFVD_02640 [Dehalococcoidia bacterium]
MAQVISPDTEVEDALTTLEQGQHSLLRWLANPQVTNTQEQKNAEDLLIAARYAYKEADEKRRELTRPLDQAKKRVMDLFQPYLDRLSQGITTVNRELANYRTQLLELQMAEQRRAMEEQAALMEEAAATGEILDPPDFLDLPDVHKTSRANLGTVTYREDHDIQIVDPNRVPRDLCEPSMTKIRARVKSGVTQIPGVLVTRKTITTARTKGGDDHGRQR